MAFATTFKKSIYNMNDAEASQTKSFSYILSLSILYNKLHYLSSTKIELMYLQTSIQPVEL